LKIPIELAEVNWNAGEPNQANGDCIYFQLSNSSANGSQFALGNCAEEKNFVCEANKPCIEKDRKIIKKKSESCGR
jgi:hypothetical protein